MMPVNQLPSCHWERHGALISTVNVAGRTCSRISCLFADKDPHRGRTRFSIQMDAARIAFASFAS
jgi:hypothetical protein